MVSSTHFDKRRICDICEHGFYNTDGKPMRYQKSVPASCDIICFCKNEKAILFRNFPSVHFLQNQMPKKIVSGKSEATLKRWIKVQKSNYDSVLSK